MRICRACAGRFDGPGWSCPACGWAAAREGRIHRWLDDAPPADLVAIRREMFEEAHHPHHYAKLRAIVDAVSAETLARPTDVVLDDAAGDWRSVLQVGGPAAG